MTTVLCCLGASDALLFGLLYRVVFHLLARFRAPESLLFGLSSRPFQILACCPTP